MGELRLRVATEYGRSDIAVRFDDHTTVGDLADAVERRYDRAGSSDRTIRRVSRSSEYFNRGSRISHANLRNGDEIELALDTGLRATASPAIAVRMKVVEGPDRERIFELPRGESTVGRSSGCDVTINDDMASRRHAVFRVSDVIEVADAGSTNGVVVNGLAIEGVHRLRSGDRVLVGDTTLLVELTGTEHDAVEVLENRVEFNRPPRIDRPFQPIKIDLPSPLDPPPKQRIPIIAAIAPAFMGLFMYLLTRSIASVLFLALSPIMMLGNVWESKRSGRKDYQDRQAEYEATLADKTDALDKARTDEVASRFRFAPGNDELLACVSELTPRLWERKPADPDFLVLRTGLRRQPASVDVDIGHGGRRDQRRQLEDLANSFRELPPVPLTFSALDHAPIGVAGEPLLAEGIARSFVLQAATLQSPRDLIIGLVVSEAAEDTWSWIKWLPHAVDQIPGVDGPLRGVGTHTGIEVIAGLQQLLEQRLESLGPTGDQGPLAPHVLILIDGSVPIERSRISRLLEHGGRVGITVLWIADDARRLPNACQALAVVEPGGQTLTVGMAAAGVQFGGIPIESLSLETAEVVARSMAPIVDISSTAEGEADLPNLVSLADILGGEEIFESTTPTLERWHQSSQTRNLKAPVGKYSGGDLNVDLRIDGPHGLVGGTTGAGKSEFLQAYLVGLAASHGPDRITFLLVDYKGGSAFGGLVDQFDEQGRRDWVGLRHTVGMITDLTPALVQRALVSLRAELHRREIIISQHRVKDLAELEAKGAEQTPPSLLIVVDEFAALANEVPEFVDGVVDIAQRGRSLGMHLLLATQKPGGVVTPNIQANTNLRVALRMATEDESRDVVRSPIAGHIDRSTPGRGVMRRGPSDLVAFQSAYVGGVTTRQSVGVLELGEFELGGIRWLDQPKAHRPTRRENDLKRLVRILNSAADDADIGAPRRPWLDPLPDLVNLFQLPTSRSDGEIVFGLSDNPERQSRSLATFHPDRDGSMLLYGMGGAGKTVTLRSLAASVAMTQDGSITHVYGLDFAGRGLGMISTLPHVGSIVDGDDYQRVTRLLKDLREMIRSRTERYSSISASTIGEFRAAGSRSEPRILVLVDGYDNFQIAYERVDRGEWAELLPRLVADGRSAGVHFVLTGTRRSSFPMALASQVSSRLVFRMASDDDYRSVDASPGWFDRSSPPGRCRFGDVEVQVAILGQDATAAAEANQFERLGAALVRRIEPAPAVRVLPDVANRAEIPASGPRPWLLTEEFSTVGPTLDNNILITGGPRSGRTTALQSLLSVLQAEGRDIALFAAVDGELAGAKPFDEVQATLDDPPPILAFDGLERFIDHPAATALIPLIDDPAVTLVVACDSGAARSYGNQLALAIRKRPDVLVLQPDPDHDNELLRSPVPRTAAKPPRGRGLCNIDGVVQWVQVLL